MQQTRFFKAVGVSNHRRVDGRAGRWRELNRFEFLVTLLAGLLLPGGSTARDVPFAAAAVIDPFQVHNAFPKDVDGDGDLDVVSLRFDGAWQVVWEENTGGDASSWSPHVIDAFASSLETPERIFPADLDRDGDLDVVSLWKDTFPSTQKVIGWHENTAGDGSAWVRHVIFGAISPAGGVEIFVADINGDGRPDAVVAAPSPSGIDWYDDVNGDGSWSGHGVGGGASCLNVPLALTVADIDGDTDADIFALCFDSTSQDSSLHWFRNDDGLGGTWAFTILNTTNGIPAGGAQALLAADLDGDGDLDLASTSPFPSAFMNLGGLFTVRSRVSLGPFHTTYGVGDLDADGDLDLVTGRSAQPAPFSWLENIGGAPSTSTLRAIAGLGSPFAPPIATPADLDGDGDLDIAGGFQWIENRLNLTR